MIARRLLERGVRVVQVWYGPSFPWDHHGEIAERPTQNVCGRRSTHRRVPSRSQAAWIARRHLGALGRRIRTHSTAELPPQHDPDETTTDTASPSGWPARGKGGHIHGSTDEAGFAALSDKVHVHDLHATILHLLGLDHERLTYRYAGRDFRLTDVHGRVVKEILS